MNKRIHKKIYYRADKKIRQKQPLTTLEYKVWLEMQNFFLRVSLPIIQDIKEEEQAKDWINYTNRFEFKQNYINEM